MELQIAMTDLTKHRNCVNQGCAYSLDFKKNIQHAYSMKYLAIKLIFNVKDVRRVRSRATMVPA